MPKLVNHYQFLQEAFANRKGWGSSDVERDINGNKQNFLTHNIPLPDEKFVDLHQSNKKILYARMGKTTNVFIIDIDKGSPYHHAINRQAWIGVIQCIEQKLGIKGIVTQSSAASGGCHIIFPLRNAVNSDRLAQVVNDILVTNGYTLRRGHLEIFPNVRSSEKAMFNLIKVPGQNDWGLFISKSDLRLAKSTLEQLENRWKNYQAQNDVRRVLGQVKHEQERISEVVPELVENYNQPVQQQYYKQPKCKERSYKVAPWQEQFPQNISGMFNHLRCIIRTGFTDRHQTNELISKITRLFYIVLGRTDVMEISTIIRALKGFKDYCGHQNQIEKKVAGFIKITTNNEKYYTQRNEEYVENHSAYIGKDIDELLKTSANREKYSAKNIQNRIEVACRQIHDMDDPQLQVKYHYVGMLAKLAHMSFSTIEKYWDELIKPFFIALANKGCNIPKANTSNGSNKQTNSLTKLFMIENINTQDNNKQVTIKTQENNILPSNLSRGVLKNISKGVETREDGVYRYDKLLEEWVVVEKFDVLSEEDFGGAPQSVNTTENTTTTSIKEPMRKIDPEIERLQSQWRNQRDTVRKTAYEREKEKLELLMELSAQEQRQREEYAEEEQRRKLYRKMGARC